MYSLYLSYLNIKIYNQFMPTILKMTTNHENGHFLDNKGINVSLLRITSTSNHITEDIINMFVTRLSGFKDIDFSMSPLSNNKVARVEPHAGHFI